MGMLNKQANLLMSRIGKVNAALWGMLLKLVCSFFYGIQFWSADFKEKYLKELAQAWLVVVGLTSDRILLISCSFVNDPDSLHQDVPKTGFTISGLSRNRSTINHSGVPCSEIPKKRIKRIFRSRLYTIAQYL